MKKLIRILPYICWIAAAALVLYPFVSNLLFEKKVGQGIQSYEELMADRDLEKELAAARAYNQAISDQGIFIYDAFADEAAAEENEYWSLLKADAEGLMGYLSIPEISLDLPVYHGTSEEVLKMGCGHLEGTSLPVGGTSTHAVLCGHTGLESAEMFLNLDELETGDEFSISVFGQELTYEVDEISVVLPEELDCLTLAEGKDYVTLVTCTPYGINSHRLLVRGSRK